ncbi:MAG: hypothetical protein RIC89_17105 [Pseudomonadales bacterium]
MRSIVPFVFLLLLLVADSAVAQGAIPGVENPQRARLNYMLNCQGCHGANGSGTHDGAVPTMQNFVGRFLTVPGGRSFLVRVPGSANAALDDAQLAELMNWLLVELSAAQLPAQYVPYTALEVARYRADPLADVAAERAALITQMRD